jgi:ketosteroid isomerase-like protein
MRKVLVVVLTGCSALLVRAQDQSGPLAVVQKFFDAMSTKDVATIHSLFAPDASTLAILPDGSLSKTPSAMFEQHLGASKEPWLERIWDAKVMQHGSMAAVWAPYDFYRGGKFSHCGIDNFQLVKSEGTWKVITVIFTVEKEGCPASPLGAPATR